MDVSIESKFVSQRGKVAIIVESHKYTEYRKMKDGSLSFRCYYRKCLANLHTDESVTKVLSMSKSDHNHPPPDKGVVERQRVCCILKRKAVDEVHTKPNKLIRKELLSSPTCSLEHSDFKLLRQCMYTSRRKLIPRVPKSFDECVDQLRSIQDTVTVNDEKFCFINVEDNMPMFTTCKHLRLLSQAPDIIVDGTFSYVPTHFQQMYSLHARINGFTVPVIHGFLSSKTTEVYVQFWMNVKHLCLTLTSHDLQLSTVHLDFEKAAHNAVMQVFPGCVIYGCGFHLSQAWFRRIQKDKRLLKHYNQKTENGKWVKMFFGLNHLPANIVYNAFTTLMTDAPVEGMNFSYYLLTNYIEEDCNFPPTMWAAPPPTSNFRTTSGAENFHSDYNRQFYSAHPNVHVVISALQGIWAEAFLKISSIEKGTINLPREAVRDNYDFLVECWNAYQEHGDMKKYLWDVATRYKADSWNPQNEE